MASVLKAQIGLMFKCSKIAEAVTNLDGEQVNGHVAVAVLELFRVAGNIRACRHPWTVRPRHVQMIAFSGFLDEPARH